MMEIRRLLTMTQDERKAQKDVSQEVYARAKKLFNGGKICGQCNNFSQIGTEQGSVKHSGLNGSCKIRIISGWVPPETKACTKMEGARID